LAWSHSLFLGDSSQQLLITILIEKSKKISMMMVMIGQKKDHNFQRKLLRRYAVQRLTWNAIILAFSAART
jgi:uncharacterized membrane protein